MFTFSYNDDSETMFITFTSDTYSFTITPFCPSRAAISDEGRLSTSIINKSWISWNSNEIIYAIDGDDSGKFAIKMKNTPEIMQSLMDCLKQWNKCLDRWGVD